MARLLLALALLPATFALKALRDHGNGKDKDKPGADFVKNLKFKHRLRVCNAYPNVEELDVYRGEDRLSDDVGPLKYPSCVEFRAPLQAGDRLEFKIKDASAGTFQVADLPNHDAVMLLIIHRHDTRSTAVAFESHVFANLLNAQVAVLDTYKGKVVAHPRIMDSEGAGSHERSEDLRFNSVVAVNPGVYKVELEGLDGKVEAKSELVALNRESYIILRAGAEADHGQSYPQELIVFPHSNPDHLRSSASRIVNASSAALMMLLCTVTHFLAA